MEDRKRNPDDGKEAASAPRGTETAEGGWSPTFRFVDASRTPPRLVVCFAEQKRNKQIPPEPLFYSRTSSLIGMPNRGRRIRFLFFLRNKQFSRARTFDDSCRRSNRPAGVLRKWRLEAASVSEAASARGRCPGKRSDHAGCIGWRPYLEYAVIKVGKKKRQRFPTDVPCCAIIIKQMFYFVNTILSLNKYLSTSGSGIIRIYPKIALAAWSIIFGWILNMVGRATTRRQ